MERWVSVDNIHCGCLGIRYGRSAEKS